MNLATIEMDRTEARRAFVSYRREVRARHNAEDEAIMRGYRALAQGHSLIRLSETITAGGSTPITYRPTARGPQKTVDAPVLAVARADAEKCWTFGIDRSGSVELRGKRDLHATNRRDRITISGFGDDQDRDPDWWTPRVRAIVPNIPPPLRPADKLGNYHILWEAEWGVDPVPPYDPALLKHVGGDLYAVVAIWDLTEVERAVLALTRS